jgi:hypothetical protein
VNYTVGIVRFATVIFLAAFFFQACSFLKIGAPAPPSEHLKPDLAASQAEAQKLLLIIDRLNDDLSSFKGIGKIRLWNSENLPITERVAWVGSEPSKFIIVVLASGHPVVKLSTDGKYLYYLDLRRSDRPFRKVRSSDASLEKLVSMPIKFSDVIALLSGRVPVNKHSSITLVPEYSGNGYVLVLKKRWKGVVEKIYVDEDKKRVRKVEMFSSRHELLYRAEFKRMQSIHGFRVPSRLVISNGKGAGFSLDIDRYIANVSVSPSMFILRPPK